MALAFMQERKKFQSTLSMRRATRPNGAAGVLFEISIHALHEESDVFQPVLDDDSAEISIHALHEESDRVGRLLLGRLFDFNPRSP